MNRTWRCPECRRRYRLRAEALTPNICQRCRRAVSQVTSGAFPSTQTDRPGDSPDILIPGFSLFIILLGITSFTILSWRAFSIHGPHLETLAFVLSYFIATLFVVVLLHLPCVNRTLLTIVQLFYLAAQGLLRWILRLVREKYRQRKLRVARSREERARARIPQAIRWSSTKAVNAEFVSTYGVGSEFVYCFTYESQVRLSHFHPHSEYLIKVGMASRDPIQRIHRQISATKTAIPEQALVLLILRTHNCRDLERWLHNQLQRNEESPGKEWYWSSTDEIIALFGEYVDSTASINSWYARGN